MCRTRRQPVVSVSSGSCLYATTHSENVVAWLHLSYWSCSMVPMVLSLTIFRNGHHHRFCGTVIIVSIVLSSSGSLSDWLSSSFIGRSHHEVQPSSLVILNFFSAKLLYYLNKKLYFYLHNILNRRPSSSLYSSTFLFFIHHCMYCTVSNIFRIFKTVNILFWT